MLTIQDSNMEQQFRNFTTFEELDEFITANTIPEDLVPLALERLVDLIAIYLEVSLFVFYSDCFLKKTL